MLIKSNNTVILEYNKISETDNPEINSSKFEVNKPIKVKKNDSKKQLTSMKYITNPIIIDAIQWKKDNFEEIIEFCGADNIQKIYIDKKNQPDNWCLSILGSQQYDVNTSDYIIKNINGDLEVLNQKLFNQLYTPHQ